MRESDLILVFRLAPRRRSWAARAVDYGAGPQSVADLAAYSGYLHRYDLPTLVTCEEHCLLLMSIVDIASAALGDALFLLDVKSMRGARADQRLLRRKVFVVENALEEHEFLNRSGLKVATIRTSITESSAEPSDNTLAMHIPRRHVPDGPKLDAMVSAIEQCGFDCVSSAEGRS